MTYRGFVFTDAIWQTLRISLGVALCWYANIQAQLKRAERIAELAAEHLDEEEGVPSSGWTTFFAIVVGLLAYYIWFAIFKMFMYFAFRCEALGAQDQLFNYDGPLNRHMITG